MQVVLSPFAQINLKKLSKKYSKIVSDIDSFIDEIKNQNLGDRIQGFPIPIYKSRIKNSSINKGKSGGFRIVYHVKISDTLYILAIYSKNEMGNIDKKDVLESLKQLGL